MTQSFGEIEVAADHLVPRVATGNVAWRGPLLLVLLSPTVAELMTGSTPVARLVYDPIGFLAGFAGLVLLYGGGALLVREAAVRWGKGWPTILALGAAYGVVEEGLAVHTFFLSSGGAVGALASYGRWAGVNTVWAVGLTLFHAAYSIALPILIVRLAYPTLREARFLEGGRLPAVGAGYGAIVLVFAAVEPAFPSPGLLVATILAVAGLVAVAWIAPARLPARSHLRAARPSTALLLALGALPFLLWLVAGTGAPAIFPWPGEAIAVLLLGNASVVLGLARLVPFGDEARSLSWVALGMVGILVAWTVLLEIAGDLGALLVGALVLGLVLRVTRAYRRDTPPSPARAAHPPPASGPGRAP